MRVSLRYGCVVSVYTCPRVTVSDERVVCSSQHSPLISTLLTTPQQAPDDDFYVRPVPVDPIQPTEAPTGLNTPPPPGMYIYVKHDNLRALWTFYSNVHTYLPTHPAHTGVCHTKEHTSIDGALLSSPCSVWRTLD